MKQGINIYQIYYDEISRESLHPNCIPLDNTKGPKDWYEFFPILKFLREVELEEGVWYAFLSPKFFSKVQIDFDGLLRVLTQHRDHDVGLFSSDWPQLALYLNVWEQGDFRHPGLTAAFEAFLEDSGLEKLQQPIVSDFSNSVYSNYVFGKRRYWMDWLAIAEKYYEYCNQHKTASSDFEGTTYNGRTEPMKVFVQERLCNYLFLRNKYDIFHADYSQMIDGVEAKYCGALSENSKQRLVQYFIQCNSAKERFSKGRNAIDLFIYKFFRRCAYKLMAQR